MVSATCKPFAGELHNRDPRDPRNERYEVRAKQHERCPRAALPIP